jgi:hypothetical protein
VYSFLNAPMRATHPAHTIPLNVFTESLNTFKECNSSSSLRNHLHFPINVSRLDRNTLSRAYIPHASSICFLKT